MVYQIQLKPFQAKSGGKYKVIEIADVALHTNRMESTQRPAKKVRKAFKTDKPGRIYTSITEGGSADKVSILDKLTKDPEFVQMVQEEKDKGYKVLLSFPKSGIPVLAGKDTKEFIKSRKGKRIIRHLNKQKSMT